MKPGDVVYVLDEFNLESAMAEERPELAIVEAKIIQILSVDVVAMDSYGQKHFPLKRDIATSRDEARKIAGRLIREKAARMLAFAGMVEQAA